MTQTEKPRARRSLRSISRAGVLALVIGAGALATVAPAEAATARNGVCDSGEFCYYFNSNTAGSISDFKTSVSNLGDRQPSCYEFRGKGTGKGICVKNNAASVWNRTSKTVTVYYNSGYGGKSQPIAPGHRANLKSGLKNENASHRIGGPAHTTPPVHGGTVSGATAAARAKVWTDKHLSYSMTHTYNGYRKDCSGLVSMAWGLAKPGATTSSMPRYGHYISKSSLKRGDAVLNSNAGAIGHVVLFDKWANSIHTKYWVYEESGSGGAQHHVIPYPYYSGHGTFKPFRYSGLT
jgi:hypothetical protein